MSKKSFFYSRVSEENSERDVAFSTNGGALSWNFFVWRRFCVFTGESWRGNERIGREL